MKYLPKSISSVAELAFNGSSNSFMYTFNNRNGKTVNIC